MEKSVLPNGWEWKKLGDESLLEIMMGQSPPGESYNDEGKGLPFFQGKTDFGDYYPKPRKWCTSPTKISLPGDVLISVRAPVGPTNLTAEKCAIGRGLTILRPKPTIKTKFLLFALRSLESQISEMGKGSTFAAITKSDLEQIEIPYTDPDIQNQVINRIEEFLTELVEARRLHEKIVTDTNRLTDSVLAEVYPGTDEALQEGWKLLAMPQVCSINPTRPRNLLYPDETETSFVPMASVDEREGRIADLRIRSFGEIKRGYTYFEENDVLFAKITPCMENGKAAIACGLNNGFGFGSTEFHVLRPHPGILPEWIYYFIRRETFRQEAKTKFRGAVGQQRVPQDFLETHLIPVPYPDEPEKSLITQKQIITHVQTTANQVSETQIGNVKTGELLGQMEQSILAQAFRGEL
ncbi:MAG: restriction endonuclease subunit S [Anaerolineaceae bacterium]|nr:restriction endonuclease subunit S [Anaerolineaceae bacterium]